MITFQSNNPAWNLECDRIVFTSLRSGDLELYTMNIDGSNVVQVTDELGYDGGAFFSQDGCKLVFRASRPKTDEEVRIYKELLAWGLERRAWKLNKKFYTLRSMLFAICPLLFL